MAYQIQYAGTSLIKKTIKAHHLPMKWIVGCCVVILFCGLFSLESVREFLIPGNAEATKAAFASFTRELQEGERFSDAVESFCIELIERDTLA